MNQTQIKINELYKTTTGWLVARSHLKDEKGVRYAVVELLTGDSTHYVKTHTTYTQKDFRRALDLGNKERIEII